MRIFLSYLNKVDTTVELDQEFDELPQVSEWVDKHHPEWTSYDVIVVRSDERAQ